VRTMNDTATGYTQCQRCSHWRYAVPTMRTLATRSAKDERLRSLDVKHRWYARLAPTLVCKMKGVHDGLDAVVELFVLRGRARLGRSRPSGITAVPRQHPSHLLLCLPFPAEFKLLPKSKHPAQDPRTNDQQRTSALVAVTAVGDSEQDPGGGSTAFETG
jgi:hypothetical protein